MEMLHTDIVQYRDTPAQREPVFFERGVCDALGFLTTHGVISEPEAAIYVKEFPYNEAVFLLPPWVEIYTADTERDQTFTEAVAVYESVRQRYTRWGYQLVEVPTGNVVERVDFILRAIETVLTRLG